MITDMRRGSRSAAAGTRDGASVAAARTPDPAFAEVVAYGEDCVLTGCARIDGQRLTDALNRTAALTVIEARLQSLVDGRSYVVGELTIPRDELLAVAAGGPRGDPGRRTHTRRHPVRVQSGPFIVRGYVHALPGTDPIDHARRRAPMIPLTEAWVEYRCAGTEVRSSVATVLVNRETADTIVAATDLEVRGPDTPHADRSLMPVPPAMRTRGGNPSSPPTGGKPGRVLAGSVRPPGAEQPAATRPTRRGAARQRRTREPEV